MDVESYTHYQECMKKPLCPGLVLMESHNGMDLASNLFAMARYISDCAQLSSLRLQITCLSENEEWMRQRCAEHGIRAERFVIRESPAYFEALAGAEYLISDVAFHPLLRKRPNQKCIGTWHGTPLKTLGFDFMEDAYVAANQKRGFLLSDMLVMPNAYTWERIRTSYQLDTLFQGQVLFGGYPRNAAFFQPECRERMRQRLDGAGKRIIAYMPTWRGKVIAVRGDEQVRLLQKLLEEIDAGLDDDTLMLCKLHRLAGSGIDFSGFRHIRTFPPQWETYDVLCAADVLVSDYSSVIFDFLCTGRPIALFCYDHEEYVQKRGCYFDPAQLDLPMAHTAKQLLDLLKKEMPAPDQRLCARFVAEDDADSCARICRALFLKEEGITGVSHTLPERKRTLVFVGELAKGRMSDSLFFYLDTLEDEVHITYMNHLFKEKWERLKQFPGIDLMPMYMYQKRYAHVIKEEEGLLARIRETLRKKAAVSQQDLRLLAQQGEREYGRYLYQGKFDVFVRYGGLDIESLKWLAVFPGERHLVLHDVMVEKARNNAEFAFYLRRAAAASDLLIYADHGVLAQSEGAYEQLPARQLVMDLYEGL